MLSSSLWMGSSGFPASDLVCAVKVAGTSKVRSVKSPTTRRTRQNWSQVFAKFNFLRFFCSIVPRDGRLGREGSLGSEGTWGSAIEGLPSKHGIGAIGIHMIVKWNKKAGWRSLQHRPARCQSCRFEGYRKMHAIRECVIGTYSYRASSQAAVGLRKDAACIYL